MSMPQATVIVTQRERFGMTRESLESLFAETDRAFGLIYVDGASPVETRNYLKAESESRGFTLIRKDYFLTPNEARNIGLAEAKTKFVVFADNDVLYSKGWLGALLDCAQETGADVVAPLTCEGLPVLTRVHHAGGDYTKERDLDAFVSNDPGEKGRDFIEHMNHHGQPLERVGPSLKRKETGFCEFHCVLARRAIFDRIGPLDEAMCNSKEHIDFSLCVRAGGGKVLFEPRSIVTYVFPCAARPLEMSDWPYFSLRWSDAWGHRSLTHFHAKWRLRKSNAYVASKKRIYAMRRVQGILIPTFRKIPVFGKFRYLGKVIGRLSSPIEKIVNRWWVAKCERRRDQIRSAETRGQSISPARNAPAQ